MGRIPTRDEARAFGLDHILRKCFGSFTQAKQAAGMSSPTKKEKSEDILATSVTKHLEGHRSKKLKTERVKRTLVIGDTHFPFANGPALSLLYAIADQMKPDVIVQVGDLYDMFAHSKFPRSCLNFNAQEEMDLGRRQAEDMWGTLQKLLPKAQCYQILGNHDVRPLKRIIESYPAGEIFLEFYKWYEFPGVRLEKDVRTPLVVDGITYIHGWSSRSGFHRDHFSANVCCGHTHRGGVWYRKMDGKLLWELNAGFLGDAESKAMSYTQNKVTQWTVGCGWIDEFGPRFISFSDDDNKL